MKWWVKRLIGRPKDVYISWPYPFTKGKLFAMTLTAGLEGYHVNVDGRHVTSFLYRIGYSLDDATRCSLPHYSKDKCLKWGIKEIVNNICSGKFLPPVATHGQKTS
ncbi:hydroxyproline O-galactosyltransferase GALT5-like [Phragmites australis]|uniref:hydroxyproline O-galactosyltransferase GALT5-like n=1 Tax=Phragmites australis TaxID=29695 RepID=UPI002D789DB8|nr:hydroxyproline O-galactosyltransferase GALT5-like [Phragmites australis]